MNPIQTLKRIIQEVRALLRNGKIGRPCPDHGLKLCGICKSIAEEYREAPYQNPPWGRRID